MLVLCQVAGVFVVKLFNRKVFQARTRGEHTSLSTLRVHQYELVRLTSLP